MAFRLIGCSTTPLLSELLGELLAVVLQTARLILSVDLLAQQLVLLVLNSHGLDVDALHAAHERHRLPARVAEVEYAWLQARLPITLAATRKGQDLLVRRVCLRPKAARGERQTWRRAVKHRADADVASKRERVPVRSPIREGWEGPVAESARAQIASDLAVLCCAAAAQQKGWARCMPPGARTRLVIGARSRICCALRLAQQVGRGA